MKLEGMYFYVSTSGLTIQSKQGKLIALTPSGWLYEHYSIDDGFGWTNVYRLLYSGSLYAANLYEDLSSFVSVMEIKRKAK